MKKILFLSLSLLTAAGMSAKVTLPSVLGSNMVLQQQCNANLWGKAAPSKKVTVTTSWDNRKYTVQAAADSTWKTAGATPAAGGPYSIRISDGEAIVLDNVMIGEVWICSGQSNMQMPVMGFPGQPVVGSNEAILNGTNSDIRMFVVRREVSDRPLDDCNTDTGWRIHRRRLFLRPEPIQSARHSDRPDRNGLGRNPHRNLDGHGNRPKSRTKPS